MSYFGLLTDGSGRTEVHSHSFIERGQPFIAFFLSSLDGGGGARGRRFQAGRVGGAPGFGKFFVNFWEEEGCSLMMPRQEPFIQVTSVWALPVETTRVPVPRQL